MGRRRTRSLVLLLLLGLSAAAGNRARANQVPIVDAGADQTIVLPSVAVLTGSAFDSDGPNAMLFFWTFTSGPAPVTFSDPTSLFTTVTFPAKPGVYLLQLAADDGQDIGTDSVEITVGPLQVESATVRIFFFEDTTGRPRTRIKFVMFGLNASDKKLDIRPGDRLVAKVGGTDFTTGGVRIGEQLTGGFVAFTFFGRGIPNNRSGGTFDSPDATFRRVKARYTARRFPMGRLSFSARGGTLLAPGLLPDGTLPTEAIPVTATIVRQSKDGETLAIQYVSFARVRVRVVRSGVVGRGF